MIGNSIGWNIFHSYFVVRIYWVYVEYRIQLTFNMEHNPELLLRKPQRALFADTETTWKSHWNFDIEIKHADEFRGILWL